MTRPEHAPAAAAQELAGTVAVVTGAARAIGRETAETLAARGAAVVSIDLQPSDDTVDAIAARGGQAVAIEADLTDEAAVAEAFASVLDRFGQIDALVNNAGLFAGIERRPFWEIDVAEWDRLMAANVRSVFLCSRAVSAIAL